MGTDERAARGAVRFSLGRLTKQDEIDEVIEKLSGIILNKSDNWGLHDLGKHYPSDTFQIMKSSTISSMTWFENRP